ncbi:MAG: hypothetical protein ACI9K3_001388 [Halovenus sp.]|jgi:hypothetical protein
MMDGTFSGVVDRVVDDTTAVLLVEEDGEVVEQVTVPAEDLPAAAGEGGRLSLTFHEGTLVSMEYDAEKTRERTESMREKLDRLSRRLPGE